MLGIQIDQLSRPEERCNSLDVGGFYLEASSMDSPAFLMSLPKPSTVLQADKARLAIHNGRMKTDMRRLERSDLRIVRIRYI